MENNSAIHHYFESFETRTEIPSASLFVFKTMLTINLWFTTSRSRRQLRDLEPWQLEDIGVSHRDAEIEATRKFFDI